MLLIADYLLPVTSLAAGQVVIAAVRYATDPGPPRYSILEMNLMLGLVHKCFLLLFAVAALHDKLYWRQYLRQFNKLF